MPKFRLLHCADLHLDSPLAGIAQYDPGMADLFRECAFGSLRSLVDTAIERRVDLVTIAGDVYDAEDHGIAAFVKFRDELRRLSQAGIPCLVAAGNHDPLAARRASLRELPDGCRTFGAVPECVRVDSRDGLSCDVWGISHPHRAETHNLAKKLIDHFRPRGGLSAAVLHANVGGVPGHENYAPCSLDELKSAPLNAWLLGHVHQRTVLNLESPLVLYPGNLQGRHANEGGPRGADLVTLNGSGEASVEFLPLARLIWLEGETRIDRIDHLDQLLETMDENLDTLADSHPQARAFALRWTLSGRGPLYEDLADDGAEQFRQTLFERWRFHGRPVFLEHLENATDPALDLDLIRGQNGFASMVLKIADEGLPGDGAGKGLVDDTAAPWGAVKLARLLTPLRQRFLDNPAYRQDLLSRASRSVLHALLKGQR